MINSSITAEMVRRARERAGESQAAFASRFGVHQSTVHDWETKGPPPRGPVIIVLTNVLTELRIISSRRRAKAT